MASKHGLTRRQLLKRSALTVGALAFAGPGARYGWTQGSDTIRVGIVGCGRRGADAAKACLGAAAGVQIAALADVFGDRLAALKAAHNVRDDRCFVGLDAFKALMALDEVSLVVLATPPAFRPLHFAEAVARGKHTFLEAPAAICPAGVKMVLATAATAVEKKLGVGTGTQRRHQPAFVETMKRIRDGAIGDLVAAQCYLNGGAPTVYNRKPEESEVEWQLRNWPYLRWLSGDLIVDQHVHQLDVVNWAFGSLPEVVHGLGGRQLPRGPECGDVYDHFGIEFTYANDVRTMSTCRRIDGTAERVGERLVGTKGVSNGAGLIDGEGAWRYEGPSPDPLAQALKDLIASLRSDAPLNEGQQLAEASLTAIMARESAYSRQQFKRAWFLDKCTLSLLPPDGLKLSDASPVPPVPVPGVYELAGFPKAEPKDKK